MSRANEENNELDDLFTKADDSDGSDDFFASLNDSQSDDAAFDAFGSGAFDADSFSSSESQSLETLSEDPFGGFSASDAESDNPFGEQPAPETEITAEDALPTENKKGKKGKAPKAKKEKAPKAKKEKAPKSDVMHGSPKPFVVLGAVFLLGILAANAVAFMTVGAGAIMFLACFDALGLLLLAIPALLIKQQRTRAVGLFDMFIALAAAFVVMVAMALLAQQAKNYGASSKVASNVAVSNFDVRA
ncbi:MAG: hypothetical protein IJY15_08040 [Thermoguttaceae bacterium]|nr:hypothetical protein [Thermoguttaceae bacterium]